MKRKFSLLLIVVVCVTFIAGCAPLQILVDHTKSGGYQTGGTVLTENSDYLEGYEAGYYDGWYEYDYGYTLEGFGFSSTLSEDYLSGYYDGYYDGYYGDAYGGTNSTTNNDTSDYSQGYAVGYDDGWEEYGYGYALEDYDFLTLSKDYLAGYSNGYYDGYYGYGYEDNNSTTDNNTSDYSEGYDTGYYDGSYEYDYGYTLEDVASSSTLSKDYLYGYYYGYYDTYNKNYSSHEEDLSASSESAYTEDDDALKETISYYNQSIGLTVTVPAGSVDLELDENYMTDDISAPAADFDELEWFEPTDNCESAKLISFIDGEYFVIAGMVHDGNSDIELMLQSMYDVTDPVSTKTVTFDGISDCFVGLPPDDVSEPIPVLFIPLGEDYYLFAFLISSSDPFDFEAFNQQNTPDEIVTLLEQYFAFSAAI